MREVVVVSGKGGTGKTTVLARYARMATGAVMADCDVDAPNLHMLLNPEILHREAFVGSKVAEVDKERCNGCGKCEELCRFDSIRMKANGDARAEVDPTSCEGCAVCARICPEKAVRLRDRVVGEWFVSKTGCGTMVHALLEPGAENSGKLVAMVKHMARAKAQEEGAELILVDGPPGIGCPVISALSGADIVVIVSEPTLSGLSDFGRIADLAQGFGAKCALVVNKADVNCEVAESLLEESRRRDIPCIGWVPYDEGLLSRMAMGAGGEADELSPAAVEIAKSFEALRWLP